MKNFKNLLFVALFFIAATVIGQTKISGTIVDESNEGLPGATVVVKGTTNGTETDFDGKFTLTTSSESGTIVVSYLGFKTMEIAFTGSADLGNVKLNEDGNILEEVVLRGIVDIAKDRQTPVAKSTIKAAEIQEGVSIIKNGEEKIILEVDHFIPLFGLSPKLGPIANWGLEIEKNAIKVNNALDYQTNIPGIYAIGDVNTYPGKLKLILCGFHEATLMCQSAYKRIHPNKKYVMKYTTVGGVEGFDGSKKEAPKAVIKKIE